MRNYELMYVLSPEVDEDGRKAIDERYNGIITEKGGEVANVEDMGKRRLAYEINNFREGYYTVMNFKSGSDAVNELDRVMRISDDVIRYLFVKEDE